MANGVSDMMSHIFERYFTRTLHTDLSDSLCEATLRTIMKNARILNGNLNDYNAWAEIAFSGNIAHNNLLGIGREQDWGCHAMEHELSALYHVDHGAGLAVVTPAWMKYVSSKHQEIFVQFAVNVMGVEGSFREPSAIIREGISRLERFYRELGLPTTMEELNILPGDFPLMAEQAVSVRGPVGGLESWMSGTSRPSTDWVAVICNTHDERGKTSDHGIPLPSLPALLTALRQSPFSRSLLATCQRFYLEVVWRNEQILFRSFSGGRIAGLRNAVPGGRIHPSATTCPCGG